MISSQGQQWHFECIDGFIQLHILSFRKRVLIRTHRRVPEIKPSKQEENSPRGAKSAKLNMTRV